MTELWKPRSVEIVAPAHAADPVAGAVVRSMVVTICLPFAKFQRAAGHLKRPRSSSRRQSDEICSLLSSDRRSDTVACSGPLLAQDDGAFVDAHLPGGRDQYGLPPFRARAYHRVGQGRGRARTIRGGLSLGVVAAAVGGPYSVCACLWSRASPRWAFAEDVMPPFAEAHSPTQPRDRPMMFARTRAEPVANSIRAGSPCRRPRASSAPSVAVGAA